MLFFEIVLWLVFILSFVGFTVVFGNRIFYNETRFITIREIMTPMLLLVLHTTSVNVYGYSWFSYATLGFALIGLALLYFKLKRGKLVLRPFLHQLFSNSSNNCIKSIVLSSLRGKCKELFLCTKTFYMGRENFFKLF